MADETNATQEQTNQEQTPQQPAENPTEAQKGAQESGKEATEEVKDSHGQQGINKERHDREMAAKDAKIAELEAKLTEAAESKKGREDLQKEINDLKAEMADERLAHKLEMQGCRDVKAAKARLDDFGGDVAKLKEACPYLFEGEKKTGSTGGRNEAATDDHEARVRKAREAAGLPVKKG